MTRFNEPNALNDVAAFHRLFRLPVLDKATIPDKKRCALRIALLREELEELEEAIERNDLVESADAFCDLQYVLSGAILEFGLADQFKTLFDEVQRSNMSKACATLEEAERTVEKYEKEKGTDCEIFEQGDYYLVYRKDDGKVLKSVNYSSAKIAELLQI